MSSDSLFAGSILQRLRLASGLVLFAFVLTHLANHALGLVSLDAMEAVQRWRTAITGSLIGTFVIIGALVIHPLLGLAKLARRTTIQIPAWELAQIATGVAAPLFLIPHLLFSGIGPDLYGLPNSYGHVLLLMWPGAAVNQTILVVLVWCHTCIGLHYWLRLDPRYSRLAPLLLALAVALPILALAGFVSAGREVLRIASDPAMLAATRYGTSAPSAEAIAELRTLAGHVPAVMLLLLAGGGLLLVVRRLGAYHEQRLVITYLDGPQVSVAQGPTLLEISRARQVPHTSICGGRARCSTCRVRVDKGLASLPPPDAAELKTLKRVRAPSNVRLACQIRPTADLTVARLVSPDHQSGRPQAADVAEATGTERVLAVLFLDVRGFTEMSQSKLPYDVVFLLNRLFAHFGRAIESEGGWIDKYMGDGLMAVFGRDRRPADGARDALRAARAIDLALEAANAEIASEVHVPIVIGMGLHAGPLVLGEIGHRGTSAMTVVGRTVNAASRLEAATKTFGCQLVCSAEVLKLAGLAASDHEVKILPVRGLDRPIDVVCIERARHLTVAPAVTALAD